MLTDLTVRNLAVLEEATVSFGPGLNVLTGETGAGKSIVVDALALLAGSRASAELVRTGSETLVVAGRFDPPAGEAWPALLSEAGLVTDPEELLVRREINREGRNRAFLNDQPVTLALLRRVTGPLLRIHAQREELELASPEQQRLLLDLAGGEEAEPLVLAVRQAHERYAAAAERLERMTGDERLRRERVDLLRFQVVEIESAGVVAGEEDELRAERQWLRHAEAIGQGLGGALEQLYEGEESSVDRLARAARNLEEIAQWLPEAGAWAGELDELRIRAEELARSVRSRLDGADADPARLDAVESRLATLERLLRKYGGGSRELLAQRAEMERELSELDEDSRSRAALEARVAETLAAYATAAQKLSKARRTWAKRLAIGVHEELAQLALGDATFRAALEAPRRSGSPLRVAGEEVDFGPTGWDRVVFLLAANPGEEARPLAVSASGGELSRIHLAVQLAARRGGRGPGETMVFDEADAGLGGEAAAALGRKLRDLSRGGQILAVTHLAQIAGQANRHLRVRKAVLGGRTRTELESLDAEERVQEIARMLAGERPSRAALSHARELLEAARR
jgi:DNA repair protein RecN (Recombination protein N)